MAWQEKDVYMTGTHGIYARNRDFMESISL